MPIPWDDNIKQTGKLTVWAATSLPGHWTAALLAAIKDFNAISAAQKLGVVFEKSNDQPTDTGGANVGFEAKTGAVSFTFRGTTRTGALTNRMHGLTLLADQGGKLQRVHTFVPERPSMQAPWLKRGMRMVGPHVLELMAIHELVHACGLTDQEHTRNEDLFQGNPLADPIGSTAAGDKVRVGKWDGKRYRYMPPWVLSGATARYIKSNWK